MRAIAFIVIGGALAGCLVVPAAAVV